MGYGAVNIGWEFIWRTDHRVVCKTRHCKPGFRQISVKSIRPGMGCRVTLAGKSRGEKTTWWQRLWRTILLEPNIILLFQFNFIYFLN